MANETGAERWLASRGQADLSLYWPTNKPMPKIDYESGQSKPTLTELMEAYKDSCTRELEARIAEREAEVRELKAQLKAIVDDANNGNEPGQGWDMVAGGLIDEAEALLCRNVSTQLAQKVIESGTNGPSENSAPTSKRGAPTVDSGQSGSGAR